MQTKCNTDGVKLNNWSASPCDSQPQSVLLMNSLETLAVGNLGVGCCCQM